MGVNSHHKLKGEIQEHYYRRDDLAKNVFAVHGADETGSVLVKPVPRDQLLMLIAQLPACLIGMKPHWCPPLGTAFRVTATPSG